MDLGLEYGPEVFGHLRLVELVWPVPADCFYVGLLVWFVCLMARSALRAAVRSRRVMPVGSVTHCMIAVASSASVKLANSHTACITAVVWSGKTDGGHVVVKDQGRVGRCKLWSADRPACRDRTSRG